MIRTVVLTRTSMSRSSKEAQQKSIVAQFLTFINVTKQKLGFNVTRADHAATSNRAPECHVEARFTISGTHTGTYGIMQPFDIGQSLYKPIFSPMAIARL